MDPARTALHQKIKQAQSSIKMNCCNITLAGVLFKYRQINLQHSTGCLLEDLLSKPWPGPYWELSHPLLRYHMLQEKLSHIYYMAESASGQDEEDPVFWLATQAGKMGLSCPSAFLHLSPTRKSPLFGYIKNPLLTKLVWSRCMGGYLPRPFSFLLASTLSWSIKNAKKELAQYLAILTSCLVNNAYLCNI